MGDAFKEGVANEAPVHRVCLTKAFEVDVHEVTNAEYRACVGAKRCSAPGTPGSRTRTSYYGNPQYVGFPVVHVSWNQAREYCSWAGKRLPSEAEWEYAARGGLAGKRYPRGDSLSCADANYGRAEGSACRGQGGLPNDTHAVGSHAPNGYDLHDMAGNVWEWVNDGYSESYYGESPSASAARADEARITSSSRRRSTSGLGRPGGLTVFRAIKYDPRGPTACGVTCARFSS
jgi:formylglycine-generating enzyme required for sulfatase activity